MILRVLIVSFLFSLPVRSFCQLPDSLPVLKEVYAAVEDRFAAFTGEQRMDELPQKIYRSKQTIEGSTENEIIIFAKESAAYYASLGKGLSLKEAKRKIEEWKRIVELLAVGYGTKTHKIGPTLSNEHIGYQYTKDVTILRSYMIDLYYIKMKADGRYTVGLQFTNTLGEFKN